MKRSFTLDILEAIVELDKKIKAENDTKKLEVLLVEIKFLRTAFKNIDIAIKKELLN